MVNPICSGGGPPASKEGQREAHEGELEWALAHASSTHQVMLCGKLKLGHVHYSIDTLLILITYEGHLLLTHI